MLDPILSRYVSLAELRLTQPGDLGCLSARERDELHRFRDTARREAWLLGRWLCKTLVREAARDHWAASATLEIHSRDARGRAIRPRLFVDGELVRWSLSISHTERGLLAAVSPGDEIQIGVDLTLLQSMGPGFVASWFTAAERQLAAHAEPTTFAACWSVKEAIYKACNDGEDGFSPLAVEVMQTRDGGYDCTYRGIHLGDQAEVRTWQIDDQIAALVAVSTEFLERHQTPHSQSAASTALKTEH